MASVKSIKLLIGIQARSDSKRLPGKIYERIGQLSILEHLVKTARHAQMTLEKERIYDVAEVCVLGVQCDERLKKFCGDKLIRAKFFEGEESDLLARYKWALTLDDYIGVVRLTAHCPFHDASVIGGVASGLHEYDYVSNCFERTYPEGLDAQACRTKAFNYIARTQKKNREHPFLDLEQDYNYRDKFRNQFSLCNYADASNPNQTHTSIDTPEDLKRAREAYAKYMKEMK